MGAGQSKAISCRRLSPTCARAGRVLLFEPGGKSCAVRRSLFSCFEQVIVGRSGYVDYR